ncbi:MAG: hypothetical protein HQM10_06245 [Candidatus Riflebacteria bacterium]|nr:hypothetical protein [Candidatus Riflebacteria bacterium]
MLDQTIIVWFQRWLINTRHSEMTLHDDEYDEIHEPVNNEEMLAEKIPS